MNKYGEAWENQNPDKIIDLFAEDWTYQDKPFKKPMKWHKEISEYWIKYPLKDQKNIKFTLWKCWVHDWTWYVEWTTHFDQIESSKHVEIRGIILITMKNWKIKDLWEYRHSQKS
jgi:hypothetical protein